MTTPERQVTRPDLPGNAGRFPPVRVGSQPIQRPLRRILVRTCGSKIGDILFTTPTLAALATAHPQAEITLLLRYPPHPGDWPARLPGVSRVLWEDRKGVHYGLGGALRLLKVLRAGRFEAVLDLKLRPLYAWLYVLAGIPIRVSTCRKGYARLLTHNTAFDFRVSDRHEVEYNAAIAAPLGVSGCPGPTHITISEAEDAAARSLLLANGLKRQTFFVVNPTFGGSSRPWPPERFGAAAQQVARETGLRIVLIGGPESVEENAVLARSLPPGTADLSGQTSIPVLGAVLKRAALHLSIDTGTSHPAAAMQTPGVVVFPFFEHWEHRVRWTPWRAPVRVVGPTVRCPGCNPPPGVCVRTENACLESVTVEAVVAAARDLYRQTAEDQTLLSPESLSL